MSSGNQVIHGLDTNFVCGDNFGPPSNHALNAEDLSLFEAISGHWMGVSPRGGDPNSAAAEHWLVFGRPTGEGKRRSLVAAQPR